MLGGQGVRDSDHNEHMDTTTLDIAQAAARLIVDEGMEFGAAKLQAVRDLGLGKAALPSNEDVEVQVREHIAIFCAQTQAVELLALRRLALLWMKRMHEFRPHLTGAVWSGIATKWSDVYLQLFCDDPKSAEITLIERGVQYAPSTISGMRGQAVEVLSVVTPCADLDEEVVVHFLIHDYDDLRGALKPDKHGRVMRGAMAAVEALVEGQTS